MASGAKAPKELPHLSQPKLVPRPTAASAARAARNAMNRNNPIGSSSHSTGPHACRTSPTRVRKNINPPAAQAQPKVTVPDRQVPKSESKPSVKMTSSEELQPGVDFIEITGTQDIKDEKLLIEDPKAEQENDCQETHIDNVEVSPSTSFVIGQKLEQATVDNGLLTVTPPELPSSRPQTPISLSHSHPPTPAARSRPTTPCAKSGPSSPCTKSRPSTPRHSCNKSSSQPITLPSSRLSNPQPNDKRTKSSIPTPIGRSSAQPRVSSPDPVQPSPQLPKNEEEDLMSVFSAKEKEFQNMKRELDMKQQAVVQVYENLRNIRERMTREGMTGAGEGTENLELKMFDVAGWSEEELARLCKDKITEGCTEGAIDLIQNVMPIDEVRLTDIEKKAATVGDKIAEFCLEGFKSRQELLDWVQKQFEEKGCQSKEVLDQIESYNNQGIKICESLSDLKQWTDNVLRDIAMVARQACHERDVLWNAGDTLVREVFRLRASQEQFDTVEIEKAIEEIRQKFEEERDNYEKEKEKFATAESQLKQAKAKISKMERQLREAESSSANFTIMIKNMENENRQKDLQFEAKARKLREALKTGEVTNNYICQQRNTLTQEVQELKDKIAKMTEQHKESVNGLEQQIKTLKKRLDEQTEVANKEMQLKNKAEELINDHLVQIEILQAKISELECLKPNPETPTEREMELWAELQATKEALHLVEDEISACKREKIRFLETLTKIAESDNKVGIQQKLASELLNREECVHKMQVQIRELSKNIKVNEQKVVQYEQYIQTLLAHIRNDASGKDDEHSIDYAQLQNEIMVGRVKLLEAERRVEELTDQLSQRDQQIDQQSKTSRAQVNHQIAAKADEIQELFTTLESKQQQIHRLEKIVLALEEQQRRAQAQRTRHEEKIAALEHELAAGGSRRERKFLFF